APARRPSRPSRGSASRRAGRRRHGTRPRPRARAGRPAGRAAPPRRCSGAERGPRHDDMPVPRAVVCLPTYNERENLEPMLRALGDKGVRVLVVDDSSPDGTGEIADRLARELDYVDVLHRERKEGLGPAYLAGFQRALAEGAELVLELDCDFSHDPRDVPRLLAAVEEAGAALAARS